MLSNLLRVIGEEGLARRVVVDARTPIAWAQGRQVSVVSGTGYSAKLRRLFLASTSDMTVWGGGTCLYETPDDLGMRRLLCYARLVRRSGKRFALLNIGLGRLKCESSRRIAAEILALASHVSLRDEGSLEAMRRIAPHVPNVISGGDMALMSPVASAGKLALEGEWIGFAGSKDLLDIRGGFEATRATIHQLVASGARIAFVPFHQGADGDLRLHERLAEGLPESRVVHISYDTPAECLGVLSRMSFVIGQRLHSLVFADIVGTPSVGIVVHPKVRYYLAEQGGENRAFSAEQPVTEGEIRLALTSYRQPKAFIAAQRERAISAVKSCIGVSAG
jgi:polysaccharide pyruvyl transferase WcaK-like protein